MSEKQSCVICAWRQHCAKKFSVADGGARCPDFSRDVSIKEQLPAAEPDVKVKQDNQ